MFLMASGTPNKTLSLTDFILLILMHVLLLLTLIRLIIFLYANILNPDYPVPDFRAALRSSGFTPLRVQQQCEHNPSAHRERHPLSGINGVTSFERHPGICDTKPCYGLFIPLFFTRKQSPS